MSMVWVVADEKGIITAASVDDGDPEALAFLQPVPEGSTLYHMSGPVRIGAHVAEPMVYPPVPRDADLRALLAAVTAERDELVHDLAECYRLSGADPDGNDDAALAPFAVTEVKRLREESDAEIEHVEAERDRLKADFESFTGHHAATERGWARDKARLAAVRALVEQLKQGADAHYLKHVDDATHDTRLLGVEQKLADGRFTLDNLHAYQEHSALYGQHKALQWAVNELAACLDGQEG